MIFNVCSRGETRCTGGAASGGAGGASICRSNFGTAGISFCVGANPFIEEDQIDDSQFRLNNPTSCVSGWFIFI